jgi:hypothetical protein
MSVLYRAGHGWCDVCPTPDGFAFVYSVDGAVVCEVNEQEIWRTAVPTDHLRYLRCALSPYGEVEAVGVGADDIAYLVGRMGVERWGPAFGQNSVGLYHDGLFQPVIQRSSESYSIGRDHPWVAFPPDIRGTSQGFRDVYPDGNIVFGDDAHVVTLEGHTFHKPNTRGEVLVGQINGTDQIDGWHRLDRVRFTAIPGPAFEPHVAQRGLQYAICARTPHGAALTIVPPYQAVEVPPVAELWENRLNIVVEFSNANPGLIRDDKDAFLDGLGRALNRIDFGADVSKYRWGRKRKSDGTLNDDALTFLLSRDPFDPDKKKIIDTIVGAHTTNPHNPQPGWAVAPAHEEPGNGTWAAIAEDGGDDDDPGDTNPPPPPDTTWQREIERRLTALEQAKFTIEVVRR